MFTRGIYDLHIIELKQIPLLEQSPADVMVRYAVKDIMASEVQRCAPPNSTKNAEESQECCLSLISLAFCIFCHGMFSHVLLVDAYIAYRLCRNYPKQPNNFVPAPFKSFKGVRI